MNAIQSILVPIDFSEGSAAAVKAARALAPKLGATIELLHVWEGEERLMPSLTVDVKDATAAQRLLTEAASHGSPMEAAAIVLAELAQSGMKFTARFESGPAAETIARVAAEGGHGLVVMGTSGRTGVRRLVLGSVAEHVVRISTVPVLTLHANAA